MLGSLPVKEIINKIKNKQTNKNIFKRAKKARKQKTSLLQKSNVKKTGDFLHSNTDGYQVFAEEIVMYKEVMKTLILKNEVEIFYINYYFLVTKIDIHKICNKK